MKTTVADNINKKIKCTNSPKLINIIKMKKSLIAMDTNKINSIHHTALLITKSIMIKIIIMNQNINMIMNIVEIENINNIINITIENMKEEYNIIITIIIIEMKIANNLKIIKEVRKGDIIKIIIIRLRMTMKNPNINIIRIIIEKIKILNIIIKTIMIEKSVLMRMNILKRMKNKQMPMIIRKKILNTIIMNNKRKKQNLVIIEMIKEAGITKLKKHLIKINRKIMDK